MGLKNCRREAACLSGASSARTARQFYTSPYLRPTGVDFSVTFSKKVTAGSSAA